MGSTRARLCAFARASIWRRKPSSAARLSKQICSTGCLTDMLAASQPHSERACAQTHPLFLQAHETIYPSGLHGGLKLHWRELCGFRSHNCQLHSPPCGPQLWHVGLVPMSSPGTSRAPSHPTTDHGQQALLESAGEGRRAGETSAVSNGRGSAESHRLRPTPISLGGTRAGGHKPECVRDRTRAPLVCAFVGLVCVCWGSTLPRTLVKSAWAIGLGGPRVWGRVVQRHGRTPPHKARSWTIMGAAIFSLALQGKSVKPRACSGSTLGSESRFRHNDKV